MRNIELSPAFVFNLLFGQHNGVHMPSYSRWTITMKEILFNNADYYLTLLELDVSSEATLSITINRMASKITVVVYD